LLLDKKIHALLEDDSDVPEVFREKLKTVEPDPIYSKIFKNNSCEWECLNKIADELIEPLNSEFAFLKGCFSVEEKKKELTEVFKMQYK